MNISSIIIKTNDIKLCEKNLSKIKGVEVYLSENNTIIAVIEAEDTNEEVAILKEIENTNGVISATMHYAYFEDSLRDDIKNMNKEIPSVLNDDTPIEKMRYTGSVDYMIRKSRQ